MIAFIMKYDKENLIKCNRRLSVSGSSGHCFEMYIIKK